MITFLTGLALTLASIYLLIMIGGFFFGLCMFKRLAEESDKRDIIDA